MANNNDNTEQQNPVSLAVPAEKPLHKHMFEVIVTGFCLAAGAALYHRFFHPFVNRGVDSRSKRAQNTNR